MFVPVVIFKKSNSNGWSRSLLKGQLAQLCTISFDIYVNLIFNECFEKENENVRSTMFISAGILHE